MGGSLFWRPGKGPACRLRGKPKEGSSAPSVTTLYRREGLYATPGLHMGPAREEKLYENCSRCGRKPPRTGGLTGERRFRVDQRDSFGMSRQKAGSRVREDSRGALRASAPQRSPPTGPTALEGKAPDHPSSCTPSRGEPEKIPCNASKVSARKSPARRCQLIGRHRTCQLQHPGRATLPV